VHVGMKETVIKHLCEKDFNTSLSQLGDIHT